MIDPLELKAVLMRAGKDYDFDNPETETNRWVATRLNEMVRSPGEALQVVCACMFYSSLLVKKAGARVPDPDDPDDFYELVPGGSENGPSFVVMQMFTTYLNGDEKTAYALGRAAVLKSESSAMQVVGRAVGFTIRAMRTPWVFVEEMERPE